MARRHELTEEQWRTIEPLLQLPEKVILLDIMPTTKDGKIDKMARRDDIRTRL
ncbi:hypothetical protein AB0H42_29490 [Nocardia sp. NPDC050799]|uniref:hypothetical protein n=1 Tax=Nocardia sp. NPDC050799 TaxID=3154842 RepID=UPI0033F65B3D